MLIMERILYFIIIFVFLEIIKTTLSFIPVYAVETTRAIRMARFERSPSLDNHTCKDGEELMSISSNSKSSCAISCVDDNSCYTIFYDAINTKCYGCSGVYSSSTDIPISTENIHYKIFPVCADGWTGYMRSCYRISGRSTFFNNADECVSYGGHAVHIQTSAENEFLKTYLSGDSSTWAWYIGITDCAVNGEWRYYDTDDLVTFTDFHPDEPDNNGGECCALFFDGYNYQWADWPCSDQYNFPTVCEIDVKY